MSGLNNCCVCPSLLFLCVSVFKYCLRISGFDMVMSVSVCDKSDLLSVDDVRLNLQICCACAGKRIVLMCCNCFRQLSVHVGSCITSGDGFGFTVAFNRGSLYHQFNEGIPFIVPFK